MLHCNCPYVDILQLQYAIYFHHVRSGNQGLTTFVTAACQGLTTAATAPCQGLTTAVTAPLVLGIVLSFKC